jgi:signal transduction histidine kinase/CheY-like chemotaxis protein
MKEATMPVTSAVQGKASRATFGTSFWLLLLIVELLVMVQVAKQSLRLAESMQYGFAAGLLIGGTALCGLAIFSGWYSQSKAKQNILAEERAQALTRKAEAEAQAKQKSRLLATMSHEIRTPLNGVIGMLGLMLETELNAEQKNYASIAHSSARSLLSFLDEILDTAKAEAKHPESVGKTELLPLMETVAELMAPRAHSKGIEVSTYMAPNVPTTVPFNSLHLRQILFNLAGNAIKFTNYGGVAIEARCDDGRLRIDVRDSGIGMTDDEAARVFQEFEQANSETQRRFGGTGLGLAISKRLAEAMRGTLTVVSTKNNGTTFSLALPLTNVVPARQDRPLSGRNYGLWLSPSFATQHLALKLKDLGADVVHPGETELENCQAIICDPVEAKNLLALRNVSSALAATPLWILLNPEERRSLKPVLDQPQTGYLVKPLRAASLVNLLTGRDRTAIATGVEGLRKVAAKARSKKSAGYNLLLVDDTAVNLLLASTMLRKVGHEVTTTSNGPDAIAMLEAGKNFDAILLDIEMPRMDGYETTRRIRSLGHSKLPILALTGNVSSDDVAACIASGMNGHLAKPFDQEDLDEALAEIMRNRAA